MKVIEVFSVRRYKAGYEVRTEMWDAECSNPPLEMKAAYSVPGGDYIGDPKTAHWLCVKRGIRPEKRSVKHCVCSVGFCLAKMRWYGWSHRAIVGFAIGDCIFEERFGDDHTPYRRHGSKRIETFADARLAACRFAESVS